MSEDKKLLVCTFSGGRTSAFMGKFLLEYDKYKSFDKLFIFCNTGKEDEKTLEFIDKCDKEWNLNIVWIEAKINKQKGKGTDFKVVDFKTASRNGEPFSDMLDVYPMPTIIGSNCTRELKLTPMNKYIKSLGYKNVITAMGIRYDERHRKSNTAKEKNLVYPLIDDILVDEQMIRNWWDKQSFDLELKDYQGNCDLCFKKSERKRLTIIKENPKTAQWWLDMEAKHSNDKTPRFDLRNNLSIEQLIDKAKKPFRVAKDKHELRINQLSIIDDNINDLSFDCFCKAN